LERICADAARAGTTAVIGQFIATKKNQPVKEFYSRHGFGLTKEEDGCQVWALDLSQAAIDKPGWITTAGERKSNDR
jgi:predicted enzyme involved in methoxymalonyl-ACP biosynthesis